MSYTPTPIDTSSIALPGDLLPLVEQLAENVHDQWAQSRLAEGWTYGPERNDALRQTPCLVPYDELPEIEKNYDRRTAVETLKAMLLLGYRIVRADDAHTEDTEACPL